LLKLPDIPNKETLVPFILQGAKNWESNDALRLFDQYLPQFRKWEKGSYYHFLRDVAASHPVRIADVVFEDLRAQIAKIRDAEDLEKRGILEFHGLELIKGLLNKNEEYVLAKCIHWLEVLVNKTSYKDIDDYHLDRAFLFIENFEGSLYKHWALFHEVQTRLSSLAKAHRGNFLALVQRIETTLSFTLIKLLFTCYGAKPEWYLEEGFALLTREGLLAKMSICAFDQRRAASKNVHDIHHRICVLIPESLFLVLNLGQFYPLEAQVIIDIASAQLPES